MYCGTHALFVIILLSFQTLGHNVNLDTTTCQGSSEGSQVDALNELGYRLMMKALEHKNSTNIVMSPVGVTVLLATALLGSTGSTYDELADIMGFCRDILENRKRHEALGSLVQALNDTSTKTLLADAVFVDQRSQLRDAYSGYLDRVYRAEALKADFAEQNLARQAINEWVKAHTEDGIPDFLSDNLPPSTKVVLLNALYFRGQWAQPFKPEYTTKMPFLTPAKKVITDFMLNFGNFRYITSKEDDLHMVALPYADNITTLYALKPIHTHRLNLTTLLKKLNYKKIDTLINKMTNQRCVVRFPKMNISSNLNLERYVKLLGAPSMFNPGEANFALMVESASDTMKQNSEMDLISKTNAGDGEATELKDLLDQLANPGIHIDSIVQKVKINIDEYGTEAIAATAGILARSAEMFYADSPFIIFIRNEKTKLVTFNAVIFDPTD